MAEPSSTAVAAVLTTGATTAAIFPFLTHLGLRADVLCAGFAGALAVLTLLPHTLIAERSEMLQDLGLTYPKLALFLRIWWASSRRIGIVIGSSLLAGYCAPGATWLGLPDGLSLFSAFILGAGAQKVLPRIIDRVGPAPQLKGQE